MEAGAEILNFKTICWAFPSPPKKLRGKLMIKITNASETGFGACFCRNRTNSVSSRGEGSGIAL